MATKAQICKNCTQVIRNPGTYEHVEPKGIPETRVATRYLCSPCIDLGLKYDKTVDQVTESRPPTFTN